MKLSGRWRETLGEEIGIWDKLFSSHCQRASRRRSLTKNLNIL